MAQRGDIVLARFPFTDLTGAKLRPVLVLAQVPGPGTDYLVNFISSQLGHATSEDVVLRPSDPAFAGSGLKVASLFRVGKIATISDALIVGPLGTMDPAVLEELVARLTRLLKGK